MQCGSAPFYTRRYVHTKQKQNMPSPGDQVHKQESTLTTHKVKQNVFCPWMLLYLLFQHLPIYSVVVSAPIYLFLFFFQTGNAVYAAHKAGIKHKKSHTMRVLYLLAKTSQWLQQEPMHFKNKQLMSFKERKKNDSSCKKCLAAYTGKEIQRRRINSMTSTEFRETLHRVDAARLRAYLV